MSYKVLYQAGQDEIEEKKSRFIAHTLPVTSEEEAVAFLNKIKKEYWDARHNCHAYTIGKNNEMYAAVMTENLPVLPVVRFWMYCSGKGFTTASLLSPDILAALCLAPVDWCGRIRQLLRQDLLQVPSLKSSSGTNYMSLQIIMALENCNIW